MMGFASLYPSYETVNLFISGAWQL
jgi:hypothetical protein